MRIPIATSSSQGRSIPLTAERLVNMYAEKAPAGSKSPVVVLGCPGLTRFCDIDVRRTRGLYRTPADGRLYAVVRNSLYYINSDGQATNLGTIDGSGRVGMADNGLQLCIVTGASGYTYSVTEGLQQITDDGFPGADTVTFLDGYFIFSNSTAGNRGQFFISDQLDGQMYDASDFATAESYPDNLLRVFADHSQLLLFGSETIEIWFNGGAADFPFVRAQGSVIEQGLGARWSVAKLDETVVWLDNEGIVRSLQGSTPVRISTHAIEFDLSRGDWANASAWSYVEEGHQFYVLTVPAANLDQKAGTYVYDAATQLWHERKSYRQDYSRSGFYARAYGKHITADIDRGRLYEQSLDVYEEDGERLIAEMQLPQIQNDGKRFKVHRLQLDMEVGNDFVQAETPVVEDEFIVLPLTYNEEDAFGEMTWTRSGDAPHVTPQGFEGDGTLSRLKSTTIPDWMSSGTSVVELQASITPFQEHPRSAGRGDTAIYLGEDGSGIDPNAKVSMRMFEESRDATRRYLGLEVYAGSAQSVPLMRPEWRFHFRFPVLEANGEKVRPQGMLFLDADTAVISGHYNDTESIAFKVDVNTGEVLDSFSFGSGTLVHITAFAVDSGGGVWCPDYISGHTIKIDLNASFTSGLVSILADVDTTDLVNAGSNAGASGIEFITISGTEYVLWGEYSTQFTPYLYVIPLSEFTDGATVLQSDRYKRLDIGERNQGMTIHGGDLYISKNEDSQDANELGWVEVYNGIESIIQGASDGDSIAYDSNYPAPSRLTEDVKFRPGTDDIWMMSEGWDNVSDFDGFLAIWSSPLDNSPIENTFNVRFDGNDNFTIRVNGEDYYSTVWSGVPDVEAVSIGGPPNANPGNRNGFFAGLIRNVRVQEGAITDVQYTETVNGDFEENSLTEYAISLDNPGAETGDTTGWTDEVGNMEARFDGDGGNITVYAGGWCFDAGANSVTTARQRFDISSETGLSGSEVDQGGIWAKIRWKQSSYRGLPNTPIDDSGSMGVRTLDGDLSEIATNYSVIETSPNNPGAGGPYFWYSRSYDAPVQSGARHIDAMFHAERDTGTNCDFRVDNIEMVIYRR